MNLAATSFARSRPASVLLKAAMAVTGFGLALWLTLHMLGNFTVFAGPEVMNGYALKLRETGLVWVQRVALVAGLGVHVLCAALTTLQARGARPEHYRVSLRTRATTWAARSMRVTGTLLLVYLVYHVAQMHGLGQRDFVEGDVHHNFVTVMTQPLHVLLYLAATALVTLHLAHGLGSALITLGFLARKRERLVRRTLQSWALLVTLGFAVVSLAPCLGWL